MSTCTYPACPRPILAKGWCKAHYNQARTGRPLHPIGQRPPRPTCTIPGCNRPHKAKGLCLTHYDQHRAGKTPGDIRPKAPGRGCSIDGCNGPHEAKGLCKRHYNQARTGAPAPGQPTCGIDGCPDGVKAGGLCNRHYCEQRRRASGAAPQPRRTLQTRAQGQTRPPTQQSILPPGWNKRAKQRTQAAPIPSVLAAEIPLRPITPEEAHGALLCLRRHGALDLAEALGLPTHPDGVAA